MPIKVKVNHFLRIMFISRGGKWLMWIFKEGDPSVRRQLSTSTYYRPRTYQLSTTPKYQLRMLRIVFGGVGRVDPAWPRPAMWSRCTILTVTYTMNMIIALTACRAREAKVWRSNSMVYFFPCSTARRYTKSAQIFNITNQANASSDERTQWDRS